jgi:protein-disulfide isomerase
VACQFAITGPKVTADIIEVMEFPELGLKHGVIGSPTTIINEGSRIRGPLSEDSLLDQVIKAGAE